MYTDLDHAWLHRVVSLVGQEPVLFSGSIESNILYGLTEDEGAVQRMTAGEKRKRVEAAAGIANAHA
jgi:ABC-type multidrug transport system fused ATPase/permease subunit